MGIREIKKEYAVEVINLHLRWLEGLSRDRANFRMRNKEAFEGQDFEGLDFRYADLESVSFKGSNLKDCNFEGADCRYCDFSNCNLEETNFDNAFLKYNDFRGSNYKKACTEEALVISPTFDEYVMVKA